MNLASVSHITPTRYCTMSSATWVRNCCIPLLIEFPVAPRRPCIAHDIMRQVAWVLALDSDRRGKVCDHVLGVKCGSRSGRRAGPGCGRLGRANPWTTALRWASLALRRLRFRALETVVSGGLTVLSRFTGMTTGVAVGLAGSYAHVRVGLMMLTV